MAGDKSAWFLCVVDRKALKALMRREDGPAIRHFSIYFGLLIGFGLLSAVTWGSWWMLLPYAGLSIVWAFAASVVHETCHGTPFRRRWLNELVLALSGWMVQMEPVSVRWVHASHHSHTSFEKGDGELILANPMSWGRFLVALTGLGYTHRYIFEMVGFCFGYAKPTIRAAIPAHEMGKVRWMSRLYVSSYLAIIAWSLLAASWMPFVLLMLPRFVGAPVYGLMRVTQHSGLAMNVQDHRQSTRSFTLNPLLRFLYFNMNHHIEHHMFPLVPFYNLPKLHLLVKDQLPRPNRGLGEVYAEVLGAVRRQQRDRGYYVRKVAADGSLVA